MGRSNKERNGERKGWDRQRDFLEGESTMEEKIWARCDRCDGEIYGGAEYWQINGECVCRECLEEFAGHWFAPFRQVAGEER